MAKLSSSKFKYLNVLALLVVSLMILSACSSESNDETGSRVDVDTSPENTIITTFYPIEFVVSEIAGEDFNVVNVTPVGAPAHDFELSPSSTQEVLDAKLAIVLGEGFQPAIEETAQARNDATVVLMDSIITDNAQEKAAAPIVAARMTHGGEDHSDEKHSEKDGHDHSHDGVDPHIWLDPVLMQEVVDVVANAIVEVRQENKDQYLQNAKVLKDGLKELDQNFKSQLSNCKLDTFVTSHDAFSLLADRYELNQEPIAGFSPENEPTPERMAEIKKLVDEKGIETIFSEELVSQRVADSLSSEAGVKVKILSPLESLTQQQVDDGEDYFSIMGSNLVALRSALKCETV